MAIVEQEVTEIVGRKKKINVAAIGMLMDNLQNRQYQYPIRSTIRELASNGIDSIREKQVAYAILTGQDKVEDHYIEIPDNSGVFDDSKFDPSYYNLSHMDMDNNKVLIQYIERGSTQKDLLKVSDNGVGLGGKRLEGYFDIAYSTKRLSKDFLGKYGLGAKVPLSTNVRFFTMTSIHNGKKFKFNIYNEDYQSITPKFNMVTGKENPYVIFDEGSENEGIVYYEETDEKNGVEIMVEMKKHHKQDVISAVQNQLLYFPDVDFYIVNEHTGGLTQFPVQAEVLYEDDYLIISRNNQYSKPHIVINGVSYGYVDFLELELENKGGNIGIKAQDSEVSINPNRETVNYDDETRPTIIKRMNQAGSIASKMIEEKLQETDFLKWLRLSITTMKRVSGESHYWDNTGDPVLEVIGELSKLIDTQELKPKYPVDKSIEYKSTTKSMFKGMRVRKVTKVTTYRKAREIIKIVREEVKQTQDIGSLPVFIQEGASSQRTDSYLLSQPEYNRGFITFHKEQVLDGEDKDGEATVEVDGDLFADEQEIEEIRKTQATFRDKVIALLEGSEEIKTYKETTVPKDFKFDDNTEEDEGEEADNPIYASDQERRKANGQIVAFTPRFETYYSIREQQSPFIWHKVEPYIADIDGLKDVNLYYGNTADEELMSFAAYVTSRFGKIGTSINYTSDTAQSGATPYFIAKHHDRKHLYHEDSRASAWYGLPRVRLVKVSKDNSKYLQEEHSHIRQFFLRINNGVITMEEEFVKWNTARLMSEGLRTLFFLNNFNSINSEVYAMYGEVVDYHAEYDRDISFLMERDAKGFSKELMKNLFAHLDKVVSLQLFDDTEEDKEVVAEVAKEMFSSDTITGGKAIELDVYKVFLQLMEYAKPIKELLNEVDALVNTGYPISEELEKEIKFYIINKRGSLALNKE